jgi:hypothetical protein
LELDYARKQGIPVLAILADKKWPGDLWDDDADARAWIKKFRDELDLPAVFFKYEEVAGQISKRLPNFRNEVNKALLSHKARLLEKRGASSGAGGSIDYFDSACLRIVKGKTIPFIGHGIYGDDGPLSTKALFSAMGDKGCIGHSCLATISEYRERYLKERELFLDELQGTIEEQTQQAASPMVYDMILQAKTPPIIVSATYDQVLEDRLADDDISYTVISHIIRSSEGEHDGNILVLRSGKPPEIVLADQFDLSGMGIIIYKPLGSPFLNEKADDDKNIDTVVITETDHLIFLGHLKNQHSGIPTAFSRPFQNNALLFLGYTLDVWHYRLVMRMFQQVGKDLSMQAVRKPSLEMEALAWKRLGADLIQMDADEFGQQVLSNLPGDDKGSRHDK